MLLSQTKSEWDVAFIQAKEHVVNYPRKMELLQSIYDNPKYYAGYTIREIDGNLGLNGSTMAEVNHSSVVAHLGPGGLMSILCHVTKLLQRQQQLYNKSRDKKLEHQ